LRVWAETSGSASSEGPLGAGKTREVHDQLLGVEVLQGGSGAVRIVVIFCLMSRFTSHRLIAVSLYPGLPIMHSAAVCTVKLAAVGSRASLRVGREEKCRHIDSPEIQTGRWESSRSVVCRFGRPSVTAVTRLLTEPQHVDKPSCLLLSNQHRHAIWNIAVLVR
jgi:hypothetical protein